MLYHVVALGNWLADAHLPYAPASLAKDGSVHCSPSEEATLAAATRFHGGVTGPLVALLIDETRLDASVKWVAPAPGSPLAQAPGALFPRVLGPVNRDAVVGLMEIVRDEDGRARELVPRN
ncbi:DUF952 domain-containing protein [Streptomyces sp. ISL-96]|uniref:DUF952 domain-containing protein n=1 Tax=Streptomyces sp. ISL-96 TaxID=2819191 RepID=UPI001BE64A9C|nr:DUF952 domain-containing protein [Streptomyces sp. ISL-96]MBT2488037.1 DUF952 domain-containing protein [Streptomyces sp. ISL-96]